MQDDIFEKLRRHLDSFILGAPESEAILKILQMPKEAEIALLLSQIPRDLATLSQSAGMNTEELGLYLVEQIKRLHDQTDGKNK